MSRKEIFAGNWKMYKTHDEALSLVQGLSEGLQKKENREIIVFPPSPYAKAIVDACAGKNISVGMQNMYFEKEGAFTGEVSPEMVKDTGCTHILIGHSERRHVFGETDEMVNKKVKTAFEYDLLPVVCVGELLEEREANKTEAIVKKQVTEALKDIDKEKALKTVIAYEPVWAIGTGKVATPEIAEETHAIIRKLISGLYSDDVANSIPILYGGSVKPDNISGLYTMENIDGVLVGGASLKVDSFLQIINV